MTAGSESAVVAPDTPREPLWHRAVALGARCGAFVLRVVPAPVAYGVACLLWVPIRIAVGLAERSSAKKGRGVVRNLRIAFRERADDPAFVRRVMHGYAWHLCRALIELVRLPNVTTRNVDRYIEDNESWRELKRTFAERQGILGVTGHMGSPELLGHGVSVGIEPLHSVMRPLALPALDRVLRSLRGSGGQVLVTKWGAVRDVRKLLLQKKPTAFLVDENETRAKSTVFVPFLGTLAATPTSVALLHLRTGAPITVGTMHSLRRGWFGRERWRFHLWRVVRHTPTGDQHKDVEAVCREINLGLSAAIRAYPEQWFWGMRRFKTRPDGEILGADGLPPADPEARQAEEALAREFV